VARQIENRSPASKQEKVLVPHRSEVATMVSATPPAAEGGAGHGTVSADEGAAGGAAPIATATTAKFTAKAFPNQDSQYFAVAEDIKNRIDAGFIANSPKPQEAIAVIASNNNSLKQLIPYLESQKISYNYRVSAAVTRIDSLQTLFALIRFVVSYAAGDRIRAEVWLPEILAAKELGLPREVYFPFSQAARRSKSWLAELEQSSQPRLQELFVWLQDTALACANSSLRTALFTLAKPLRDYYRRLQQQQPYATIEFNYGLKAFVAFVEGELCESGGEVVTTEAATDPSGQTARPPRLKDAIRLLDSAARFHIEISTEIPIVQSDAITLTTAHSSKGLEYELVYLIDADNRTWRGKHGENPIISSNMLLSEKRDDDDCRRLLFVALTRAKDQLNTSFAKSEIVAELLEEMTVEDVEPTVEQAQQFSELSWQEQYYPQQAEIADIAKCAFKERSLSASLLSSFVEFDPDALNGVDFFTRQVVNFPFEPSAALEFGNLVHAFLEEYLNRVIKAVPEGDGGDVGVDGAGASGVDGAAGVGASGGEGVDAVDASGADGTPNTLNGVPAAAPDGVASAAPEPPSAPHTVQSIIDEARRRISWLDFEDSEIRHMQQRFDAIVREFLPGFARLAGGDAQAERWLSAVVDEVPLVGKADLIVCDPASRSLRVCDYKTGKAKQRPDSMTAYMRQLRFYKLLIENSSEFEGWTVCGGADVFVEPELGQGGEREQGGEPGRGGRGGGQPPHGGEPQPEPSHGHGSSSGLQEPQFFEVSEAEAEQLRRLIKAVWYRLQNGLFDTQEFLQSAHFKALAATTDEGKKPRKPDLQAAYEQWLIDDYEQRER
jgi:DNA helicase-2/ATP-dependent DNA helicase PcrA